MMEIATTQTGRSVAHAFAFAIMAIFVQGAPSVALGDMHASCHAGWDKKANRRIDKGVRAYLGEGTKAVLGEKGLTDDGHKFVLGGTGTLVVHNAPVYNKGKGLCKSGDSCMKFCQALCCMGKAPACAFASLYRQRVRENYVVYGKDLKLFKCKIWETNEDDDGDKNADICRVESQQQYAESCPRLEKWFWDKVK